MATTTTMTGAAFDRLPFEEARRLELVLRNVDAQFGQEPGGISLPDCECVLGPDTRLCPDVAILLKARWASVDPDRSLILVLTSLWKCCLPVSDSLRNIHAYLSAGTQEVCLVSAATRPVDTLTTSLLPGWELSLHEIFSV